MTRLAMPATPRQFALVLDADDPSYDEFVHCDPPTDPVLWWGTELAERAALFQVDADGRLHTAHFRDADSALARWSRLCPVKLTWP